MLWLAAGVVLLGLLVSLALLMPVSLTSNLQARAAPSGVWAVAIGFGMGPFAVSAAAAAAVPAFATCHVFGRQLLRMPLRWPRRAPEAPLSETAPGQRTTGHSPPFLRFVRALDPVEVALACWHNERVVQVESLVVDLDYSFRDVALTGRTLAALYMLSALLPERCRINQTPSWAFEDRAQLVLDGRFRIWLGRLMLALMLFVLKHRRLMVQRSPPASE